MSDEKGFISSISMTRGKAGQMSSVSLVVFRVHIQVADSGDEVIEKQGFPIVDTHGPAFAMLLLPFCLDTMSSYRRN